MGRKVNIMTWSGHQRSTPFVKAHAHRSLHLSITRPSSVHLRTQPKKSEARRVQPLMRCLAFVAQLWPFVKPGRGFVGKQS